MSHIALLAAAGRGQRCGNIAKQFMPLHGKTVLWHATRPFVDCRGIDAVWVIVAATESTRAAELLADFGDNVGVLPVGGDTRAASVLNGLAAANCAAEDWVLVHDAARPCLRAAALTDLLAHDKDGGAVLALPATDSLKHVAADGRITDSIACGDIWRAQTPQLFRAAALSAALTRFPDSSDEAAAMLSAGEVVHVINGDTTNIKITYPEDFALAEHFLRFSPSD